MTEAVAPDDLGKRSAAAENGDAAAGADEGTAEAHLGGDEGGAGGGHAADMGGGAVGEPIWRDGDYIGGTFFVLFHGAYPTYDTRTLMIDF